MSEQFPHMELSVIKDARESLERFAIQRESALESITPIIESMAPVLETIENVRKTMGPYLENIQRIQAMVQDISKAFAVPKFDTVVFRQNTIVMRNDNVSVRLHPDDRKALAEDIAGLLRTTKENRNRAAYPLPNGAKLERLKIKFVDGHTVKMKYPGMPTIKFDYKDVGFLDRKTQNPDTKWEFLRAIADNGGSLPVSQFDARYSRNVKYETSERLKTFLGIAENPFHPYRKSEGYYPKFSLISEADKHPFDDENVI
ncbi:MAG TPA: hypothetical protein VHE10_02545 [Candidatus Paceibacterota bacterium]|nr:hypothetical protein [Candidatus Paceibacterota bacterium]